MSEKSERNFSRDKSPINTETKRPLSPEGSPVTSLFIRNIENKVTKDELKELFIKYGEIKDIYIPMKNSHGSESKGYGFVNFVNLEDAKVAKEKIDNYNFKNQNLIVTFAKGIRKSKSEMSQRYSKRFDGRYERGYDNRSSRYDNSSRRERSPYYRRQYDDRRYERRERSPYYRRQYDERRERSSSPKYYRRND
jgi:FUS-interacting serine-arginine-rich protein 1